MTQIWGTYRWLAAFGDHENRPNLGMRYSLINMSFSKPKTRWKPQIINNDVDGRVFQKFSFNPFGPPCRFSIFSQDQHHKLPAHSEQLHAPNKQRPLRWLIVLTIDPFSEKKSVKGPLNLLRQQGSLILNFPSHWHLPDDILFSTLLAINQAIKISI